MQTGVHDQLSAKVFVAIFVFALWGCPQQPDVKIPQAAEDSSDPSSTAAPPVPDSPQLPSSAESDLPELTPEQTSPQDTAPLQVDSPPAEAEMASNGADSPPSGTSSENSAQGGRGKTAERAASLAQARRLLKNSKSKRSSGNTAEAFLDARTAWNLVQGSDDPSAKALANKIHTELTSLAAELSANSSSLPANDDRPLILK